MTIDSEVMENTIWYIHTAISEPSFEDILLERCKQEVGGLKEDIDFIASFDPVIFCNDHTGVNWVFDTKLPSGRWLENITVQMNNGRCIFKASIYFSWCQVMTYREYKANAKYNKSVNVFVYSSITGIEFDAEYAEDKLDDMEVVCIEWKGNNTVVVTLKG